MYFNETTKECKIYQTRPNICKVDYMFEVQYFKYYSQERFYQLNAEVCNRLQKKFNLDKKYNVNLGE